MKQSYPEHADQPCGLYNFIARHHDAEKNYTQEDVIHNAYIHRLAPHFTTILHNTQTGFTILRDL
jgi:hypothetical protein